MSSNAHDYFAAQQTTPLQKIGVYKFGPLFLGYTSEFDWYDSYTFKIGLVHFQEKRGKIDHFDVNSAKIGMKWEMENYI